MLIRYLSSAAGGAELQRGSESAAPTGVLPISQVAAMTNIPVVQRQERPLFKTISDAGPGFGRLPIGSQISSIAKVSSRIVSRGIQARSSSIGGRSSMNSATPFALNREQLAPALPGLDGSLGTSPEDSQRETESSRRPADNRSSTTTEMSQSDAPVVTVESAPGVALQGAAVDQFMSDYADDSFAV